MADWQIDQSLRAPPEPKDDERETEFEDAISGSIENFNSDRQPSISSLGISLPDRGEIKRQREETSSLLEMVEDNQSDPPPATKMPSSLSKAFGGWIKNATSLLDKNPNEFSTTIDGTPLRVVDATAKICSYPNCIRLLNIATVRFHCRKCNGWYCGEHAGHPSFAMMLDIGCGEVDWIRGQWSRVCQLCFYPDHTNVPLKERLHIVSHTEELRKRRAEIHQDDREAKNLLRDRWERLNKYGTRGTHKIPFRIYEKNIGKWVEDNSASNCKICRIEFTQINRKHHCRLCGEIICGEDDCSLVVGLDLPPSVGKQQVRICFDCNEELFVIPKRIADLATSPGNAQAKYRALTQVKNQIADILPRFNEQLVRFETELESDHPNEEKVENARHEAMAARDTLMLLFKHMDSIGKQMKLIGKSLEDLEYGETQAAIFYYNIHRYIVRYLQDSMFTLQLLPKYDRKKLKEKIEQAEALKRQEAEAERRTTATTASPPGSIFRKYMGLPKNTADLSLALDAELLQKIEVLNEQKSQIGRFIQSALEDNQYSDVRALRDSLEQIQLELKSTQKQLEKFNK